MITTCTVVLLSPGREPRFDATRQRAWGEAPYDRGCAAAGEADEPVQALLLVGRPLRSDRLGETFLPKRLALPVFASDALSSVARQAGQLGAMLAS